MSKKNLLIVIVLFFILLIISFFVVKKENSTWARGHFANKTPVLTKFDVNKVKKFRIYDASNKMEILFKNGQWVIFNKSFYPANFQKIRKFILKLKNMNIAQKVLINQNKLPALKLISPDKDSDKKGTGTVLELYDTSGNIINAIIFGKFHYAGEASSDAPLQQIAKDGRFLLTNSLKFPVLVSSPFLDAAPEPTLWLDKSFVNLTNIKMASRIDKKGKTIWKIARKDEKSPFGIAGLKQGEIPLPRVMFQITSAFHKFDFKDVLTPDTPTSLTGLNSPDSFIYESCNGNKYKIDIASKNNKTYLKLTILKNTNMNKNNTSQVIPDSFYSKWIYEIPHYTAKNLIIDYDDMVKRKKNPISIMGQ